jgi:molybdenum cofactor cytidylyltransferase
MQLKKALAVNRGEVISLVGAGGKTTTMFRLAEELAAQGWRVITTTTTMIWREQGGEPLIVEDDTRRLMDRVQATLSSSHHLTVAASVDQARRKLIGLQPSVVDALSALAEVDALIVEADGAKGRSLKAPAGHEPVIPSSTTLLVPMAAVDALGRPLDERTVHRPEIAGRLAGVEMGAPIDGLLMSTVMLHHHGGLKNAPASARVVPLLNKVCNGYVDPSRKLAASLLEEPRVERVLLAAVAEADPVQEVWPRVGAVVLAAGGSRRFGSPKQLLPWKGQTLLEHVVDTVLDSSVQEVVVVLGHQAGRMRELLGDRPVKIVINEEWEQGQSSSVRAGLEALAANFQACLFVLADQPNITSSLIDDLLTRYRRTLAPVVAPVHRDQRGNPVLFDRELFSDLLDLKGDEGGRSIIERHRSQLELVEVADETVFLDIDTVDDYEAAK